MKINQAFVEWACSPSGCDGGNADANIWVSGIEWGGSDNEYYKKLPDEISKGKYIPSDSYDWKNHLSYTYGRSLAKLYTAINGQEVGMYVSYVSGLDGSELFKLNLYPIAFRNTDEALWKKYTLDQITGFSEKYLFRTWCFLHRFPAISELVQIKKPKLIIGTGISYLTDFFVCFAGKSRLNAGIDIGDVSVKSEKNNYVVRKFYWAKLESGTTLVVIPFFSGPNGLNSDSLIQQMGDKIRKLIT